MYLKRPLIGASIAAALIGCGGGSGGVPGASPAPGTTAAPGYAFPVNPTTIAAGATGAPAFQTFATAESGTALPQTFVAGPQASIGTPTAIAIDRSGRIYVADGSPSIRVFAANASGDALPLWTLTIPSATAQLSGLAVDSAYDVYACDCNARAVYEFAPGTTGLGVPARTIAGPLTTMECPRALAIDAGGRILVEDFLFGSSPGTVLVFPPNAAGNETPQQAIRSSSTQMPIDVNGLAVAPDGTIAVSSSAYYQSFVYEFPHDANGDVPPMFTIAGTATGFVSPEGLAFDASGMLYVGDAHAIEIFEPGASGNVAPVRAITGIANGAGPLALH